ncbi:uncharacterized protein [Argopecten irradians]|uniref:uncharacterized protein n=1 Tax=Argopecten irradians TaxID=31199 RepID=UPI00371C88EC
MKHDKVNQMITIVFAIWMFYLCMSTYKETVNSMTVIKPKPSIVNCMHPYMEYTNMSQNKRIIQFLDRRHVQNVIIVYPARLPPRLHVNNGGQRHDGVFPRILPAYQTEGVLRVVFPVHFQNPDNPYTTVRVRIQTIDGGTGPMISNVHYRSDENNVNLAHSDHGGMGYTANQRNGISREGRHIGRITVRVHCGGSHIQLKVLMGTSVSGLIGSREFVRKVSAKWNIPENDLRGMVLRQQGRLIETLENDCDLHLSTGHWDLFI